MDPALGSLFKPCVHSSGSSHCSYPSVTSSNSLNVDRNVTGQCISFPRQIITVILGLWLSQNILALSFAVGREQRIRMGSRKHPWHWGAQCLSTEALTASLLPGMDLQWPQALCVLINVGWDSAPSPNWSVCPEPPSYSGCEIHQGLG